MNDALEIGLKNEIKEIAGRIDTIMKKIDALVPETKEDELQEAQHLKKEAEIIEEEKDISEEPS